LEGRARELDALAAFGHGQTRPPREIRDLCRTVAAEVPARQLRERLAALEIARLRCALLEQRIRELLSAAWAADDDLVELGTHDEVGEALAFGGDTGVAEHATELGAGQVPAAREHRREGCAGARGHVLIDPKLAVACGESRTDPARGQV